MGILDPTEQYLRLYRSQIRRALQVLRHAKRFECLPFDGDGIQREECEHGDCVDATIVEQLLEIFGEGQQ